MVIVNEAFIRRYFGNGNPIGRTFTILGDDKKPIEIVSVVGDVKEHGLLAAAPLMMYLPYRQRPVGEITFFVHTSGAPLRSIPAVRRLLKNLDPFVPLSGTGTLNLQLEGSVSKERVSAELSSIMGLLALALASVGLYGVIAYSVSRETKSIGIRMALGAQAGTIQRDVFRRVLLLVSSGIGIGLLRVFGLSRYLKSFRYGLTPNDPASIALAGGILIIVSLAAAYFPARRAAHVDPAITLRDE